MKLQPTSWADQIKDPEIESHKDTPRGMHFSD